MRLVNAVTLKIETFGADDLPEYAILSHTWGNEEVTLQEVSNVSPSVKSKSGYQKVEQCCRQALSDGIGYCWIDTCNIDKTSSAELSEAINCKFNH
jgi:hypothetical protein